MQKPIIREQEDQNLWNFLFSVFFFVVLIGALWILYVIKGGFPTQIPVFDAILLAFASFRITRLIAYDKITRFFREWFVEKREFTENGEIYVELVPLPHGMRRTLHDLIECPWCIGLWAGLISTFFYFMFPWAWFIVLFLAVAGAGSLFQLLANLIGWRAENYKLDANAKEKAGSTSDRSGL